jgi:hypothetical protein
MAAGLEKAAVPGSGPGFRHGPKLSQQALPEEVPRTNREKQWLAAREASLFPVEYF